MSIQTQILIEAIAKGQMKAHSMLKDIKANTPLSYKAASAKFMKVKPGEYEIVKMIDNEEFEKVSVDNPIEAKLAVIEFVVDQVKTA